MIRNKKGFTLVELLAVIVILAIILVIAVPQIIKTIDSAREGAFSSSAKLIATTAEKEYLARKTIGDTSFEGLDTIPCTDVVKENTNDYQSCDISFNENGKATVTLVGAGKFAGKYICNGNKTSAEVSENACSGGGSGESKTPVSFANDSWSTIIAAVQAAEENNTEYPTEYAVGNTKTIQMELDSTVDGPETYTLRVANATPCDTTWMNDTAKSQTACGFVLEFAQVITTAQMNSSSTNAGGWPASEMRTYINSTIYNAIPATLKDAIINTRVVSGHGKNDTTGELDNDNFGSTDKLYLLSTYEVWGGDPGYDSAATNTITRHLDYYASYNGTGVTLSSYGGAIKNNLSDTASLWWLRSADSANYNTFYTVNTNGGWNRYTADIANGVSPAFRIGNVS